MRVAGYEHVDEDDNDDCSDGRNAKRAEASRRDDELDRLAVLAARGDEAALGELLRQIHPPVVRFCRAKIGPRGVGQHTAEDIAQEVLIAVCAALKRFRPDETRWMAFVFGITRNKVADAFRSAGRDRSDPVEGVPDSVDVGNGPEIAAVLGTEVAELRELLEQLPELHRTVLVLRIALNYSAEETATVVGSTAGAVRVTQHRALGKLRVLIAERHALDE